MDGCSGFGGTCTHVLQLGCCAGNTACDDADACTIDQCIDHACVHTHICCAADAECDDGDDICTTDLCLSSFCSYVPTGVEGCCIEQPIAWDFEVPVVFETTQSAPPCGWQVGATDQATSGGQTLWYGDPATGDYNCGLNAGTALSEPIFLPPGLTYRLDLNLLLDVEDNTSYDLLLIELLVGETVIDYWTKYELPAIQQWVAVSKDISALAGETIRLRFTFDSKDGIANYGGGAFIDDVVLHTDCIPVACINDDTCVDDLPGTVGSCDLATCIWTLP